MVEYVNVWDLFGPSDKDGQPLGPVEINMNTVLAKEAMARDPGRYVLQLPKNVQPGKADRERKEREARLKAELEAERLPDPHFPKPNR
jgi:hypothetical protein